MKDLYKKIGAIALAGMVVFGGAGALGGIQKVDAVSWLASIKIPGEQDVEELARKYDFVILVDGSRERVDQYVKKEVKNKALRLRLSEGKILKNKNDLEEYIKRIRKDKRKMYRIEYEGFDYIILLK